MPWPTPQDYNEAVQNPGFAFTDQDLRSGSPGLNSLGLPQPICGGFACVYKIRSGSRVWAARCFLSEVRDQQTRYEAISRHLERARLPQMVPFTFLSNGIRLQGKTFPLLKMEWVQGETLDAYVKKHISDP